VPRIRELREGLAAKFPSAFAVGAVADRVGVDPRTLRRWERGEATPTHRHARALAREFGVSVEDLELDQEST
jgi:transcriptional regulator with XRE-family HTH domain